MPTFIPSYLSSILSSTHTGQHRVKYSSSFSLFNRIVLFPSFKTQQFLETYSFYRCFFPTTNETFCLCSFTLKRCLLLLFVALPLSPQHGSLFELCEGNTEVTGSVRTKSSAVSSLASIAEDLSVARLSSCSTASFQSNEPPVGVWCSADNWNTWKEFLPEYGNILGGGRSIAGNNSVESMIIKRAETLKNSVNLKIPFDEEYSRRHQTLLWHKSYANHSIVREDRVEVDDLGAR